MKCPWPHEELWKRYQDLIVELFNIHNAMDLQDVPLISLCNNDDDTDSVQASIELLLLEDEHAMICKEFLDEFEKTINEWLNKNKPKPM
jgi:hypothetical protein